MVSCCRSSRKCCRCAKIIGTAAFYLTTISRISRSCNRVWNRIKVGHILTSSSGSYGKAKRGICGSHTLALGPIHKGVAVVGCSRKGCCSSIFINTSTRHRTSSLGIGCCLDFEMVGNETDEIGVGKSDNGIVRISDGLRTRHVQFRLGLVIVYPEGILLTIEAEERTIEEITMLIGNIIELDIICSSAGITMKNTYLKLSRILFHSIYLNIAYQVSCHSG